MSEEVAQAIRTLLEHHGIPTAFVSEAQLLDWTKSSCRDGPKVKFGLIDDDEVRPFEMATVAKGKVAGQLYILIGVRIDEPVQTDAPKASNAANEAVGGAVARLAGRWSADPLFLAWVAVQLGKNGAGMTEDHAAAFIRQKCGIESRAELDHNETAKQAFMETIRKPFMDWNRRR